MTLLRILLSVVLVVTWFIQVNLSSDTFYEAYEAEDGLVITLLALFIGYLIWTV